ncbi:YceH family protein [Pseudomonas marincola]|uniref:YceH family protein n=1 Tax=Pseudomonas marincola TaxID=437900 RepID=UPI0008F298FA|nr:DUF480 domain-containing protein [Pseudomonas marincola]SFT40650.1 hypothetical protein SAMN05216264_101232 [Pseudomonas marincola]
MNDQTLDADTAETADDAVQLSAVEARVLGCLIEKQATTPEAYPLTLNALVLACNQKTSREPIMNLAPGPVGQALRSLEARGLARLQMGSRADRWEQRADKTLELVAPQVALVGLLLLRGPQTLNELLTRSSRLFAFDDVEHVQQGIDRLITRGMACQVARQSGQREDRYMHLLGEPADFQAAVEARAASADTSQAAPSPAYEQRLQALEARIAELEERLAALE